MPWLLLFLVISAAYLYSFPQPNIIYAVVVLLHALSGVVTAIILIPGLIRLLRKGSSLARAGWLLIAAGAVLGLILIKTGTPRSEWEWLYLHIAISLIGVTLLVADQLGRRGWLASNPSTSILRATICLAVLASIGYGSHYVRESWQTRSRIQNPTMPPDNMNGEGDGPEGAFFPSSAQVYGKQKIPSKFFMESDSCKRCHEDIYNQWFSSAHHFSSFNNQWYRKAIEYMQDTVGTKPSKWCGGCHDPAVLYSGLMDTPIKQIVHRPESQAGLGCMMCHSIAKVKSTMGQADFYLEYPKLHELAATQNPVGRALHDFVIRLNPEPHRRVFLKPFMKTQTAEFCSTCHKVHLDVPVNHYRWFRGFNEYDNWQASGVSGQGARSFYYPPKPQQCADCHMPMESSKDAGNINGFVHSHRFPGANTAVPTANEDAAQLKLTEGFLKSGALTVDIFALSPAQAPSEVGCDEPIGTRHNVRCGRRSGNQNYSRCGRRSCSGHGAVEPRAARAAPRRYRARRCRRPHQESWTLFPRRHGRCLRYLARTEGHRRQRPDHLLERHGRRQRQRSGGKRRALLSLAADRRARQSHQQAQCLGYARSRLCAAHPAGRGDTVHYRMSIPESAGNKITLHARLCYRKFSWYGTRSLLSPASPTRRQAAR